jgi:hypothetical protein
MIYRKSVGQSLHAAIMEEVNDVRILLLSIYRYLEYQLIYISISTVI